MPERLFFELEEEKRRRIYDAGLQEFSEQGYEAASTNSIVKAAGIGKGSLFKYFLNKEALYFYVLDRVLADLLEDIQEDISNLQGDVFDIIIRYAEIEFNWHLNNPCKYKLMKRAFFEDNSVIYQKTMDRYGAAGDSMYDNLLLNIDVETLQWGKEKTVNILKWILEGFNAEFIKKASTFSTISHMKDAYIHEIKEYMDIAETILKKNKGVS